MNNHARKKITEEEQSHIVYEGKMTCKFKDVNSEVQ